MPDMYLHPPVHHTKHPEQHFQSSDTVRDVVIGLSDSLTVPFALAAGLAGAVGATRVVVLAGLAEIAAGSIAMGLGGYLASRGDSEHYASERRREQTEVVERPKDEEEKIYEIFSAYGVSREAATPVLRSLQANPPAYVDFMMRFELGLDEPAPGRALGSAITIALSYVVGGAVPLAPYLLSPTVTDALRVSIIITLIALLIFGGLKGRLLGSPVIRSAVQTMLIGGARSAGGVRLPRPRQGNSLGF